MLLTNKRMDGMIFLTRGIENPAISSEAVKWFSILPLMPHGELFSLSEFRLVLYICRSFERLKNP